MATIAPQRRTAPRVPVALDVTLARAHGSAVPGRTQDLGPAGMRVASRRPLKVDEHLDFDIDLGDGGHVSGRAHVVREHAYGVYALRFDGLAEVSRTWLAGLAARGEVERRDLLH